MSMILYNYRYRGPHEYDKFIYNVLQLVNETDIMEKKVLSGDYSILQNTLNELDRIIDTLTGEDCTLQKQLLYFAQIE